jgi:hypothetical protein
MLINFVFQFVSITLITSYESAPVLFLKDPVLELGPAHGKQLHFIKPLMKDSS